jgi:hypothetical protein
MFWQSYVEIVPSFIGIYEFAVDDQFFGLGSGPKDGYSGLGRGCKSVFQMER